MNDLTNPLNSIIAQAAKLPARTGATEKANARFSNAGKSRVILADVSSSMAERAGSRKKITILAEALDAAANGCDIIAFSSIPVAIAAVSDLPTPSGSTALHLALAAAIDRRPASTLVISDGRPDNEDAALDAAKLLTGRIDVLYVGPDDDYQAISFMRRLAAIGVGTVVVHDLRRNRQLGAPIRALLTGGKG